MSSSTRTRLRGTYGWSRKLGALASFVAVASCSGAHRIESPYPNGFNPRQRIEVWRATQAVTLNRVSINADSIVGVPMSQCQACDSCERAFALSEIDSLRTLGSDKAAITFFVLPVAFAAAALIAWRISEGD